MKLLPRVETGNRKVSIHQLNALLHEAGDVSLRDRIIGKVREETPGVIPQLPRRH